MEIGVELWRAPLDVADDLLTELTAALSPAERTRADARRSALDRRRFLADHGWRRRLLGARTGRAPDAIAYRTSPAGRPEIDGPGFSASRAGATALYALCAVAGVEVGVDVEEITDPERPPSPRFADRVLAPAERVALEELDPAERPRALGEAWTRKEAYFKVVGSGLVFPLTDLDLWRADGAPVRVEAVEVHQIDAGPARAAALAVRLGPGRRLELPFTVGELTGAAVP